MKPRSTTRFALAVLVLVLLGQLSVPVFMAIGTRAKSWVAVAALPLAGLALALVFSVIYDGPLALAQLLVRSQARTVGPHSRRSASA